MTYREVQLRNERNLKEYLANNGKGATRFKFRINGVDLKENLCLVNGEWSDIGGVIKSIMNRSICVTNISVLRTWKGFNK